MVVVGPTMYREVLNQPRKLNLCITYELRKLNLCILSGMYLFCHLHFVIVYFGENVIRDEIFVFDRQFDAAPVNNRLP